MAEEKKQFFLVTGMSEAFRKWDESANYPDRTNDYGQSVKVWELRIQLATAQQLTMISESLKKLCEKLGA